MSNIYMQLSIANSNVDKNEGEAKFKSMQLCDEITHEVARGGQTKYLFGDELSKNGRIMARRGMLASKNDIQYCAN